MGLAPYGTPRYVGVIYRELVDLRDDGSFTLNQKSLRLLAGLTMTNGAFDKLFGGPPRVPETSSRSGTWTWRPHPGRVEEVMLRLARAHEASGSDNLCLAGGVALNCVANGRILREGPFKKIWIQPAAGDAGGALGVALDGLAPDAGQSPHDQRQGHHEGFLAILLLARS